MPKLQYRIFGRRQGNFRPPPESRNQSKFVREIERVEETFLPPYISEILAPRVAFTTRIVDAVEDSEIWSARFIRTQKPADGALVRGYETAVAIFNGDCPLLCLYQDDQLAVLHGGYRCLMRADPNEEGIIEVAIKHFDPKRVKAFIFGGIGPCCWLPEYDDKPEILDPAKSRHRELLTQCLERTIRSPAGAGRVSVDLYALAKGLLLHVGVPEQNIDWNITCTCCAMEKGQPRYWSHTRFTAGGQEGVDGRNFSVAWLER